ncbi:BREX-2 system phosphatase PglZ [Nocardia sp. 004]|uniref:BREX-2 system phosphatase PglZ n=1 Tax=Nocardia sp. 004 TaxID=3385978 RepID=UPI0039A087C7
MTSAVAATALPLSRTTVAQYLSSHKRLAETLGTEGTPVTLLLRGAPGWEGESVLALTGDRHARVMAAASPLAVHEAVLAHAREIGPDPRVLVILTDIEEHDLDPAILARTHRGRVHTVDRWDVVRETFGANDIDPRLRREGWACEALLDATGAHRWPTELVGGTLTRTPALAALTARRLDLGQVGDRIDPFTLLDWSQRQGGPALLLGLRAPEREGITEFLSETDQSGATGRMVTTLAHTGHGDEAVAYGLVCAALWEHASPSNAIYQARGRVERWLGDSPPAAGEALDQLLAAFGRSCEQYLRGQLVRARTATELNDEPDDATRLARKIADTVLTRADQLVRQFGADAAAASSPILHAGLAARFTAAGEALGRGRVEEIDAAVTRLHDHGLAPDHRVRISRVKMAQRLTRWLHTDPDPTVDTVAEALDRQLRDTAWADRALDYLEAGGDEDAALRVAYRTLIDRTREIRREFDREFAKVLAVWTQSGSAPGSMLTVETFLHRIVRPLAATQRVLLIVVDGMSAAIATELAGELRGNFAEYNPLPGDGPDKRCAMAAALPSLTSVSRTSLFAGALRKGDQATEKRLFSEQNFWGAKRARVFHKNDLRSAPGDRFGTDLHAALADQDTHVAVVLNTIDDRLAKESKLDDSGWEAREIGDLRALMGAATAHGMVVLITSDHGHVIDRHGVPVAADAIASARHRLPVPGHDHLADSEIALHGPRVVWPEPGASIVALWDNDSRYSAQKAGYHGGAALAEITIPVLAFLAFDTPPPTGWLEVNAQKPPWWRDPDDAPLAATGPKATVEVVKRVTRKARENLTDQISFDIAMPAPAIEPAADTSNPADVLISRLFESEMFEAQLEQLSRKPVRTKLKTAIRALLDGPQPITALAQRVGYLPDRARGFAAILVQLLNVDGVQVLETLGDGRTLRLHTTLLRDQFGLPR